MAGVEWKASLSALDRYEVIQTLRASLPPAAQGDAVAIEQAAYQGAASREGYNAACDAGVATRSKSSSTSPSSPSHDAAPDETSSDHSANDRGGTRIGPYTNCTPIAEGVTSQVFRSGSNALKVITTHRNIEPHNPRREAKILGSLSDCPEVITLLDVFHDQAQCMVLRFPYMPLTLAAVIDQGGASRGGSAPSKGLSQRQLGVIFRDVLLALSHIHPMGIIHRDIKPSAILLASPTGPGRLSDFGTAWHPSLSAAVEPPHDKILDIGTGPYRAPEVLFGNKAYDAGVDMWSLGVALAEAATGAPPFESRPANEDGSQLGLILSVFKTLGTPTPETWPEAQSFKVSPFQLWTVFPQRPWTEIMPGVNDDTRAAVAAMVRFDKERVAAAQALELPLFANI
ncbi:serine/threonine protein kinase, CMGC group [Purpureocillium lilacinum]|uniref:cyclin-dependent kinase n=1 Tax=Purpureocillium lilacinum TaxID=33203 RepID=A0A179HK28_PURLI|nr:serine/threonine protein kinase, CMGC group [Purpureocillium lilacinum]OAQ90008.1 serine/threonine protein kinase, CMGC group [Purpureocillium lilacinum]